jgi:hypothetical protein
MSNQLINATLPFDARYLLPKSCPICLEDLNLSQQASAKVLNIIYSFLFNNYEICKLPDFPEHLKFTGIQNLPIVRGGNLDNGTLFFRFKTCDSISFNYQVKTLCSEEDKATHLIHIDKKGLYETKILKNATTTFPLKDSHLEKIKTLFSGNAHLSTLDTKRLALSFEKNREIKVMTTLVKEIELPPSKGWFN